MIVVCETHACLLGGSGGMPPPPPKVLNLYTSQIAFNAKFPNILMTHTYVQ